MTSQEDPAVTLFREYLRIKSVHPSPDFEGCNRFFQRLAKEYDLEFRTFELTKGKPIFLLTWQGKDPKLPTILLNSHMDVVPVVPEKWKYDAFEAVKDSEGNIYARGTQDMKCVTIQYFEAIRRLKKDGFQPLRTIHASIMPDEEIGGKAGMELFVETEEFRALNVAVALDEGLASPDETFTVFCGERAGWWFRVKATGPTGHGSRFIENTAASKLLRIINNLMQYREDQFEKLQKGIAECGMKLGDVTTINLTALKSGITSDGGENFQLNIVPGEAEAGFDMRIPPSVNLKEFKKQLDQWTSEEGVSYAFVQHQMENHTSGTSPEDKWWNIFSQTLEKMGLKIDKQIFPAATDSRFIRNKGIPAYGFSPMNHTPILLHDHNEFLNEKIFLKGIDIYHEIITDLASATE